MDVRAPAPEYVKLLLPYGEVIQNLALETRKLILEEAPAACEFIYQVYTVADHFVFTDRPGDAFVFTTTHAKWVNLGFNFGAFLPDPHSLLEGDGKLIRHVRIGKPADLEIPGVRDLVRSAIARAERPGKPRTPCTAVRIAQPADKVSAYGWKKPDSDF